MHGTRWRPLRAWAGLSSQRRLDAFDARRRCWAKSLCAFARQHQSHSLRCGLPPPTSHYRRSFKAWPRSTSRGLGRTARAVLASARRALRGMRHLQMRHLQSVPCALHVREATYSRDCSSGGAGYLAVGAMAEAATPLTQSTAKPDHMVEGPCLDTAVDAEVVGGGARKQRRGKRGRESRRRKTGRAHS